MRRMGRPTWISELDGPFRGTHAIAEGWLSTWQLRSPLYTRLYRDVYVPRGLRVTHELRCRAVSLIAPPTAMFTGLSAAALRGLDLTRDDDPVELVTPRLCKFVAIRGLNSRRMPVDPAEYEPWAGCRLATPVRLTVDVLTNSRLRRSLPRTVGFLDALLRAGFVRSEQLAAVLEQRHDHGITRARTAFELADPRAESIPESEVRVWLTLAGIPPELQVKVFDAFGRHLGRLDMAYRKYKLAIEYDGEWHALGLQPRLDQQRRARLMAAGWSFVIVTRQMLYDDPHGMVAQVQEAIHACQRLRRKSA